MLIMCSTSWAQSRKGADEAFRLYKYAEAARKYEQYLKKNAKDYTAWQNLVISFERNHELVKANLALRHLADLPEAKPMDFYHLSKNCMAVNMMADAQKFAQVCKQKSPGLKADYLITSIANRAQWLSNATQYTIKEITAPQKLRYSSMAPIKYKDGYLLTIESPRKSKDKWGENGYTELVYTNGEMKKGKPLYADKKADKIHEAFGTIDGNTIYFTESYPDAVVENGIITTKLRIQSASLQTPYTITNLFKYNSKNYNTAHPAISPNGQYLVFTSDRQGGKGSMDLYVCKRQGKTWSAPRAITKLNTFGKEQFPRFIDDNTFSFSSNALPGLGGQDIFISTFNSGVFGKPINAAAPINSSYDDFALLTNAIDLSGYITSNRISHTDHFDVIQYTKKEAAPAKVVEPVKKESKQITIMVLDKLTNIPIRYANVSLKTPDGTIYKKGRTDVDGRWKVGAIPSGTVLDVSGELNGVKSTMARVVESDYNTEDRVILKKLIHNDLRFTLLGHAKERKSGSAVSGVNVKLDNESQGTGKSDMTTDDGSFFFQLEQKSNFSVKGIHDGLYSNNVAISTKGLDRSTQLYAKLLLNLDKLCIGEKIPIEDIYYNYDKWDIRNDAKKSLNNLVDLLNKYNDMKIELGSHTDARGSDAYNETLSQKRAKSAVNYIISRGISKSRIVAKGYGEKQLKVNYSDCSEAQHQENRRTEVKILSCPSCPSCN